MVKRLGIGSKALAAPRGIVNVDGTSNQEGALTQYTDLEISSNEKREIQRFFITDLGTDRAIFRYPWLQMFKPTIDWDQAKIRGTVDVKTTNEKPPLWAQISRIKLTATCIAQTRAFKTGDEIHMSIGKTNVAQQWVERSFASKKDDLTTELTIPAQYSDFADIFSEKAARRFPPA